MSEWLDEMLSELPAEDSSPDLVQRIQANIAIYRRRRKRFRTSLRVLNGVAALAGILLLIPGIEQLTEFIPSITSLQVEEWVKRVLDSPNDASLELWTVIESWVGNLLSSLETVLIVAFILLSLSALLWLSEFVNGKEKHEGVFV